MKTFIKWLILLSYSGFKAVFRIKYKAVRIRFEQQLSFWVTQLSEVKILTKSRDEMPALPGVLETIFVTKQLSETIFELLEAVICNHTTAFVRYPLAARHSDISKISFEQFLFFLYP